MADGLALGSTAAIVVAESFSLDAWQRVHLHDVCDGLVVRQLPARRRLCACAKVWALPPGDHEARLLLVDPDGAVLAIGQPKRVRPAEGLSSCTVLTAFAGVLFRSRGRHEVALEIDGHRVAAVPLELAIGRPAGEAG
jgi:hypothetical protein